MKQLLLLSILFYSHWSWAQDPYYINYTTNDGLPSATIYSIFQDENGILWFTTDAGIVKYNSHTFSLFNTDDGLSDNEVFHMKKDHKGRIWLLTLNGKTCYFFKNKIYNESNSALVRKISGTSLIVDFYEDGQNNCYFVFKSGEISIVNKKDEVTKKVIPDFSFSGVWKNKNSLIYLSTIGVYDENNRSKNPAFGNSNCYRMYHIEKQNYFSEQNHLYRVNSNNGINAIITLPDNTEILQLYIEHKNKIWICTRNGLYLYENQVLKKPYFQGDIISNITKDFEGSYWVSTLKNGIYYVPSFDVFVETMNAATPPKLNCISINDQKELWVGGDNNNYFYKSPGTAFVKRTYATNGQTDQIKNIRFFNSDTYVVGKKMVLKIDPKNKIINYGFGANDIMMAGNDFLIGYSLTFKLNIHELTKNYPPKLNNRTLLQKRATVFAKDAANNIWLGTNYGLYQYNKKDSITNWSSKIECLQATITDLEYDAPDHTLFVATASKGIIKIKNGSAISQISKKEGLNSITCNTIKKIAPNYYLVGSNNGLNSILLRKNSSEIKNLNAILGLKNKRINDINFLDDIVYLATDNGLLYFNIKNIERKKSRPKCLIESLENGKKTVPTNNAVIEYSDNDISINYIGISYINQNNLTYYYKLDERNDTWSSTKETRINYQSLSPGKYSFSAYCVDGFGVKSPMQKISFKVLAPFWQKTWFLLLVVLLLGYLVYVYVKYRLKVQQRKFEIEKAKIQMERDKANLERQMINLEQKALRLQMNPHFIFNALNTIKGYYSEGDVLNASSYISKFSKLLRMLLENTEQVIPLATEIEMLALYISLTQTRYKNKFEYELFVDEHLNTNEVAIPTLLLQPIVENAIIHGLAPKEKKGLLKIYFIKKGMQLECIVEDNGIGREASKGNQKYKEYESKAIEITTERIALFSENVGKSTFEIIDLTSNQMPSGTRVLVTIPLISIW